MDIFQFFDAGNRRIQEQLREILRNGTLWSNQILFDHVARAFTEIKRHFELQDSIVTPMTRANGNSKAVDDCLAERKSIMEHMDFLLMSHIDDVDFRPEMLKLLRTVETHVQTSHEQLFSEARHWIPVNELAALNSNLQERLFS